MKTREMFWVVSCLLVALVLGACGAPATPLSPTDTPTAGAVQPAAATPAPTATMLSPTATTTPAPATVLPPATLPPTATPIPAVGVPWPLSDADREIMAKAEYEVIDPQDLQSQPEAFRDKKIAIMGTLLSNITVDKDNKPVLAVLPYLPERVLELPEGGVRFAVYIRYDGNITDHKANQPLLAYGTGAGTIEVANPIGDSGPTSPIIIADSLASGPAVEYQIQYLLAYGHDAPLPTISKDTLAKLDEAWEVTWVGEHRDASILYVDGYTGRAKAGNVYVSVLLKIKNVTSAEASFHSPKAIVDGGPIVDPVPAGPAANYCPDCAYAMNPVAPGQEVQVLFSFQVPEDLRALTIGFPGKTYILPAPRFRIETVDKIPPFKP